MANQSVRGNLQRAHEEIEDICENVPISEATEARLVGLAEQLQYLAEGGEAVPEALASPDPNTLDTISEHLAEAIAEADGDATTRLERARNEVLLAKSVLDDRMEKQRRTRTDPS